MTDLTPISKGTPINHPPHYQTTAGIEAIDVMEAQFGGYFHLATAVKYILRHQAKGHAAEDLRKAAWYVRRLASMPRLPHSLETLPESYVIAAADAFDLRGPAREALFRIIDAATKSYPGDRAMALRDAARLLDIAADAHGKDRG